MEIEVTYDAAKEAYPNEVQSVIDRIRSSKSRDKDVEVEKLFWQYVWAETAVTGSAGGLIHRLKSTADKTAEERKSEWEASKKRSVVDRVSERKARLNAISLMGTYNRACVSVELPAGHIPTEVLKTITTQEQDAYDEDQRLLGLTEEELEAEANEALKQLAKSSGFTRKVVELPEGICCELRMNAAEGYDLVGVGHQLPTQLELHENRWWLVRTDWFSTPIKHCPWCGHLLPTESFELGGQEEKNVDEKGMDAMLDAIEHGMKIQSNIDRALAQQEQEGSDGEEGE